MSPTPTRMKNAESTPRGLAAGIARLAACLLGIACSCARGDEKLAEATARAIREETLRPNGDPEGYALPLACSWVCGEVPSPLSAPWGPANQMQMIAQGHHLLPWFVHPEGAEPIGRQDARFGYFVGPMKRARQLRLPITLIGSQWEKYLSQPPYFDLPAAENPNIVGADGKVVPKVSPFGPIRPWYQVGRQRTDSPPMRQLQEWYPDPPLVMFMSNNEHGKLTWPEAETDVRYVERHGRGRDGAHAREQVANGWIQRYRALQGGLRDGLVNETWKRNSLYVGYDAFGPPHFARWDDWVTYATALPGRVDSNPLMWDGGSPSYYTHNWDASTDYKVWSPQVEFMNFVFMLEDALKLNPKFWFELSIWDGYLVEADGKTIKSKRSDYRAAGQVYDPERFKGFVQFGMWLLRPRAVRDFRGYNEPWPDKIGDDGRVVHEGGGPYFMAIVEAVDRVHRDPVLREWWRKGQLVANRAHPHPYQSAVPPEYKDRDRWFLLDTSLDPPRPWKNDTTLEVFALALARGAAPNREWLIYAHAPLGARKAVEVKIPGLGPPATIDVPVGGAFFEIRERP